MDGLDLLKKDWNKNRPEDNRISSKEIYSMLHKKSSSIVKTLFYISIAELALWIIINALPYLLSEDYKNKLDAIYENDSFIIGLSIFSYAVILVFIYLLFRAQRAISVTDNAKKLMESILNTRKIIKYYVLYNLIMAGISLCIGFYYSFKFDPNASELLQGLNDKQIFIVTIVLIAITAIFILIIWLFYKLIYGLLLKRLIRNYNELKKIET